MEVDPKVANCDYFSYEESRRSEKDNIAVFNSNTKTTNLRREAAMFDAHSMAALIPTQPIVRAAASPEPL